MTKRARGQWIQMHGVAAIKVIQGAAIGGAVFICLSCLSSCGQTGPLSLPDQGKDHQTKTAAKTSRATNTVKKSSQSAKKKATQKAAAKSLSTEGENSKEKDSEQDLGTLTDEDDDDDGLDSF